jgi:GNAT superfamily N-acetyltransferase
MAAREQITMRRLARAEMAAAAFDQRLPWLAGLDKPDEDCAFWNDIVFAECEVWGAEDGNGLVGVIAFRQDWIEQLYILPVAQAKGVGTMLLDIAKSAQRKLLLWTFQKNVGARRFYERHGFVSIEETDGSGNEEREPDVLYRWDAERHRL